MECIFNFKDVDCDKDEKLASQYKIKGYPTIKYARVAAR